MFVITPVTCLNLNQTSGNTGRLTGSQHVIIWALHNLTARHSPPSAVFSGRRMQPRTPVEKLTARRKKAILKALALPA